MALHILMSSAYDETDYEKKLCRSFRTGGIILIPLSTISQLRNSSNPLTTSLELHIDQSICYGVLK